MNANVTAPQRTVLVTGGGRGIGAATAWLCAQHGWAVAVNYTHGTAAAQAMVARIRGEGGTALALQADVADEAQVVAMFETIDHELPPLGALVNNAGVIDLQGRVRPVHCVFAVARPKRVYARQRRVVERSRMRGSLATRRIPDFASLIRATRPLQRRLSEC